MNMLPDREAIRQRLVELGVSDRHPNIRKLIIWSHEDWRERQEKYDCEHPFEWLISQVLFAPNTPTGEYLSSFEGISLRCCWEPDNYVGVLIWDNERPLASTPAASAWLTGSIHETLYVGIPLDQMAHEEPGLGGVITILACIHEAIVDMIASGRIQR
jgi:hypothetical protein